MPELPDGETLQETWADLGFVKPGERLAPLEWSEMESFARLTGEDLYPEEWRIVREMSEAYCYETTRTSPSAMSPLEKARRND